MNDIRLYQIWCPKSLWEPTQENGKARSQAGAWERDECRGSWGKRDYERQSFEKFDVLLNGSSTGPRWLGEAGPADIVREAIHYRDGKVYDLFAYCIMPNHVHMIVDVGRNGIPTYKDLPLFRILQSLKRHTARQVNKILNRCGTFLQDESYDHVIRDGKELERTIWYILMNLVSAGLIEDWKDWRWSYCKAGIIEM